MSRLFYTGVGSRKTPKDILDFMVLCGKRLDDLNYIGRSRSQREYLDGGIKWRKAWKPDYLRSTERENKAAKEKSLVALFYVLKDFCLFLWILFDR